MMFRGSPPSEVAIAEGGRGLSVPASGGRVKHCKSARIGQIAPDFAPSCFEPFARGCAPGRSPRRRRQPGMSAPCALAPTAKGLAPDWRAQGGHEGTRA